MIESAKEDLCEPYFTPCLATSKPYPAGFETWVAGITQKKYRVIFPDKTRVDARIFMDHQKVFNCGSYTNYLIDKYNETN